MLRSRRRSRIVWIVIVVFLLLVLSIHFLAPHHQTEDVHPPQIVEYNYINKQFIHIGEKEPDTDLVQTKMETDTTRPAPLRRENINTDVHIFYYYWYKNKQIDGGYEHWNHKVLPHWRDEINKNYPLVGTSFDPDQGQIGANYWPERGLYSSFDKKAVTEQFLEMRDKAKVNVVVISWWALEGDEQSSGIDHITPMLFEVALELDMRIAFHLEPYNGRTALSTKKNLQTIMTQYGKHPALYRRNGLPMCYVYDSYHTPALEWSAILSANGTHTIRGTDHDHIMISLYLSAMESASFVEQAGFDGIYTYFASQGFTYGSTLNNWQSIAEWSKQKNLIFIPSVGPGYIDTKIRPWNEVSIRARKDGEYYDEMWKEALKQHVPIVSVTSYNEWHEGTQIEPAIPREGYSDYSPMKPDFYLTRTAHWVDEMSKNT